MKQLTEEESADMRKKWEQILTSGIKDEELFHGKAVVKKSIELPENIQIKVLPNQFIYTNHLGQNGTLYKDKCATLVTACSAHVVTEDFKIRKLTPVECERLQTLPDNYTAGISDTQRYKCLGNGWTVDVIAHIFRNIT